MKKKVKCPYCNKHIESYLAVCPRCENLIKKVDYGLLAKIGSKALGDYGVLTLKGLRKRKSKYKAMFLCLVGGIFGAHKFYEGNRKIGKLYLFTAGLFLMGPFVDFFKLLITKRRHYDAHLMIKHSERAKYIEKHGHPKYI